MRLNSRIIGACLFGLIVVVGSFSWMQFKEGYAKRGAIVATNESNASDISKTVLDGSSDTDWLVNLDWQADAAAELAAASTTYSRNDTATAQFATAVLEEMMLGNMFEYMGEDVTQVEKKSEAVIAEVLLDDLYTFDDLTTTLDVSMDTLKAYGNRVIQITYDHAPTESVLDELTILSEARQSGDPADLELLAVHVTYYENVLNDTLEVVVPVIYQLEHVTLLNTYQAHLKNLRAMQLIFTDPLQHSVRLNRYASDVLAMQEAYRDLYTKLYVNGVRFDENDIVSSFLTINEE